MKSAMRLIYMADVINSKGKLDTDAYGQLKKIVDQVNKDFKHQLGSPLTITLGDEFQGIVGSGASQFPSDGDIVAALDIIYRIEEQLVFSGSGVSLRHVLHEGTIDTEINKDIAHGMIGDGLREARSLLNNLKSKRSLRPRRFLIHLFDEENLNRQLMRCFLLYEALVDRWKHRDAQVINAFLQPTDSEVNEEQPHYGIMDYKEVAEELGRDVPLMWRRERSLYLREYQELKNLTEDIVLNFNMNRYST